MVLCRKRKHNKQCYEWGIIAAFLIPMLFIYLFLPEYFAKLKNLVSSQVGMAVILGFVTALVARKLQVAAWENDRPFNDGDDHTPDPYLFNPGPGASFGLRAFMPQVETYSFFQSPISWATRQTKRKVAVLMDDGTVAFPWFLVAWISSPAGGGTRIPVPQGWSITAEQARVLQNRRDKIKSKKKLQLYCLSEYEQDFLAFTDLIFGKNAIVDVARSRLDLNEYRLNQLESGLNQLESGLDHLESGLIALDEQFVEHLEILKEVCPKMVRRHKQLDGSRENQDKCKRRSKGK